MPAPVVIPTPTPASAPTPAAIPPPQTTTNIPTPSPAPKSDALSPTKPSSPPIQSWDSVPTPVATTKSTPTPLLIETSHNIEPTPHVPKLSSAQIGEIKITTSIKPEFKPRNNLSLGPVNVLKDVEPADVKSTWDMPTTPLVRIDMERTETGRGVENDPFLAGLNSSKKVEVKSEVNKKVIVVDEPGRVEIVEEKKPSPPKYDPVMVPVDKIVAEPSANVKSTVTSPPSMPGPFTFAAMAGPIPSLTKPMITSPPQVSSIPRSGVPIPVPVPPTPRPATKSPTKTPVKPILVATPVIPLKPTPSKPTLLQNPPTWSAHPKRNLLCLLLSAVLSILSSLVWNLLQRRKLILLDQTLQVRVPIPQILPPRNRTPRPHRRDRDSQLTLLSRHRCRKAPHQVRHH